MRRSVQVPDNIDAFVSSDRATFLHISYETSQGPHCVSNLDSRLCIVGLRVRMKHGRQAKMNDLRIRNDDVTVNGVSQQHLNLVKLQNKVLMIYGTTNLILFSSSDRLTTDTCQ